MAQRQERANESRLENVVARLNCSLNSYRASGGSVAGLTDALQVIERLKRKPDAAARYAGFTGNAIPDRLQSVTLGNAEVESSRLRAIWNPFRQRFETTRIKVPGICRFEPDDLAEDIQPENRAKPEDATIKESS